MTTAPASTIDEVIERLDAVIARARRDNSRLGYFPALYRKVTVSVKEGIREAFFEDGERMERLDVVFANRYLEAIAAREVGDRATRAWEASFAAAGSWWPIVLQHLLLGMNAHINLDLGIAAARTAPGAELPGLEGDFNRINEVLGRLVDGVKEELAAIWPRLSWLDRLAGNADDEIVNFSISAARDQAWDLACRLAPLPLEAQQREIAAADEWVAGFAKLIRRPGPIGRVTTMAVRLGERGSVSEIIDLLM